MDNIEIKYFLVYSKIFTLREEYTIYENMFPLDNVISSRILRKKLSKMKRISQMHLRNCYSVGSECVGSERNSRKNDPRCEQRCEVRKCKRQ